MSITTVRTIGQADVNEEVIFVTKTKLAAGEIIKLKPDKPIVSSVYGQARVLGYLGPGRDQAHRRYAAIRIS